MERLHATHAERQRSEEETKIWAQDLEKALVDSQTELERIRAAYEELARSDEERSLWARDLEKSIYPVLESLK